MSKIDRLINRFYELSVPTRDAIERQCVSYARQRTNDYGPRYDSLYFAEMARLVRAEAV